MTEQEIEKLREKLGSEYSVKRQNGAITVELVDIWDGVDFYENHLGIVKPISESLRKKIKSGVKFLISPSTEAAYVEQLKAKAKELYGEINDGDRFDRSDMGFEDNHRIGEVRLSFNGWDYSKSDDKLYLGSICIYQQGRWAKKIQQAIVTPVEIQSEEPDIVGDQVISIRMKIIHGHISKKNRVCVAYHIAKCLEDYLNKS